MRLSTATVNVTDDDPAVPPSAGRLQFSVSSFLVNENDSTGKATVTVVRTGGSAGSVSVAYATTDGTATAGSDYTAIVSGSGLLTWEDGETGPKSFTVDISNDAVEEGSEALSRTLRADGWRQSRRREQRHAYHPR